MKSCYPHIGLLTYAKQFSKAASVIVNCGQTPKTRIATTYLYGHAIELAIKSILLKNGVPLDELKKRIGHDLEKALKKADAFPENVFFENKLREIVEMLNAEYGKKHLEYHPGATDMSLPSETCMQSTVEKLIKNLDGKYRACLSAKH